MDMHEDIGKILLTEEEIKVRVRELGAQLKQDYAGILLRNISKMRSRISSHSHTMLSLD